MTFGDWILVYLGAGQILIVLWIIYCYRKDK